MKKTITLLSFIVFVVTVNGQDITGQWNGVLKIPGMELRVKNNIVKDDKGYV
jgi:hypothetical protein